MKLLLFFALLLVAFDGYGQPAASPAQAYKEAFRYLKADSTFRSLQGTSQRVAVFDSIVHIPQQYFLEELSQHWGYSSSQQKNRLRDSLSTLENAPFKPYFSSITAQLTTASGAKKSCTVIVFSRFTKNMLLAEVSDNQDGGPSLRNILSTFDQSILYLFVFGPDGKIQRCYRQFVNYN